MTVPMSARVTYEWVRPVALMAGLVLNSAPTTQGPWLRGSAKLLGHDAIHMTVSAFAAWPTSHSQVLWTIFPVREYSSQLLGTFRVFEPRPIFPRGEGNPVSGVVGHASMSGLGLPQPRAVGPCPVTTKPRSHFPLSMPQKRVTYFYDSKGDEI